MNARILRRGSRGSDVREWQVSLAALDCEPGSIDGVFGAATEAATRRLQVRLHITNDGVVGPETRHAAAAALQQVPPPATPGLLPAWPPAGAHGMWIWRLADALERAGGPDGLAADLVGLHVGHVRIKVTDGRELMNQARLGETIAALHARGIVVVLWGWIWAVYYTKDGRPASTYHTTVQYVEEQARVLADQCRRWRCLAAVVANVEGGGAWSTGASQKLVFGPRNIKLFGSQKAADAAMSERATALGETLESELPGTMTECSTHGMSSTQRLPWRALCTAFHAIGAQLYNPGTEGYRARVHKACAQWRTLGARRVRVSGPAWHTKTSSTKARWIGELRSVLRAGVAGNVDTTADWWVYEFMTQDQRAALVAAA